MGKKEEAESFLAYSLEKFPRNSGFYFMLAAIRYQRGEIENAIALLEQSLKNDPQNTQAQGLYWMIRTGQKVNFED